MYQIQIITKGDHLKEIKKPNKYELEGKRNNNKTYGCSKREETCEEQLISWPLTLPPNLNLSLLIFFVKYLFMYRWVISFSMLENIGLKISSSNVTFNY